MRIEARVKKVEVVGAGFGPDKLEVTCERRFGSGALTFTVDDGPVARATYVLGRLVDVEITPRRT